jgi:predicted RecB family nuclease
MSLPDPVPNKGVQLRPISPLLQLPNTYRTFYGAFAELRPFQYEVIQPILQGQDLILQAATGSGKTAAVLAPCLERAIGSRGATAILYVVPTRALAQDLRRRLEPILHERLGLRLGIRTGDVKRLPAGQADVLLTTPESLDVMLGSPNREVQAFLQRVSTLIVDEVHQFMQGYRGRHLAYLLQRLERGGRRRLQKLVLSATLAGPEVIREALGLRPDAVFVSSPVQRQIQSHLVHLQHEDEELVALIDDLIQRFGHRKLLLFANSRSHCDRLFALLRHHGYLQQATYLHYSNLKSRQRHEVERQFQRRAQALCIATSTLELGIDIGDVDAVVLYEPPESVTTFAQRLGRANRQAQTTVFWGICRGPRAGEQLLQFLALCSLAQQGVVETMRPGHLPSVLVQQVLSRLYEHKILSTVALQALFSHQAEALAMLLPVLEERHWLRRAGAHGGMDLWRGGWRYAETLQARQVWSNFPDIERVYTLEVDGEAVADLPTSMVRQLEVGDRVDLAGRRLRLLAIQDGERQVVRATPVETQELKELFWVGSGPPVSWEVAQAVRPLLQPDVLLDVALAQGLFSRTRTLLQRQRQRAQRLMVLHNGVELSRTPQGLYRYATYLGSMGNLILQRTIEAYYAPRLEDFTSTADALAVECTHRIDLQQLPLPIDRQAFQRWAAQHLQALQALLPLNTFCRALPMELLVEEVTDWLWDERLSQTFAHYRQHSSAVAHGDPQHLEWGETLDAEAERPVTTAPLRDGPQPPILVQEKARLGLTTGTGPLLPAVPPAHQTPRALTGTMLANYIQHRQCDRLLSFDFLPFAQQPAKHALVDSAVSAARAGQGRVFEDQVLTWLQQQGVPLYRIAEHDAAGRRLSLRERQTQSFDTLNKLVDTCATSPLTPTLSQRERENEHGLSQREREDEHEFSRQEREPCGYTFSNMLTLGNQTERGGDSMRHVVGCLVQAMLVQPTLLGTGDSMVERVDGIGIPDVIEVAVEDATVWLTVIDIKGSPAPRYAQQWQVAFYAALLQACLQGRAFALPVRVADSGVIFTRQTDAGEEPARHTFGLAPYLAVLPQLQRHLAGILTIPVLEARWQLQPHCRSCAYFDTCYRQALSTDDVMLLPVLTPGEHLKLRMLGLHTLPQAARWFQDGVERRETPFSPQQMTSLRARVRALLDNRLELLTETTTLYLANMATAIFVHLLRDPISGRPRAWGLHRLAQDAPPEEPRSWISASEAEEPACQQAFVATLRAWWQAASTADQEPHLVTFGAGSMRLLREAIRNTPEAAALDFLWPTERHIDLHQLLIRHFAVPIPLGVTLRTAAQVWGLDPAMAPSQDLLPGEGEDEAELLLQDRLDAAQVAQIQGYLQMHLVLQQRLWHACTAFLRSDWPQHRWDDSTPDPERSLERACVDFLEQQRRWRERDILALQRLSLADRVEHYRALGPVMFQEATLEAEGRFLYHFQLPPEAPPARFRAGDFLRLNAVGSPDLQEGVPVLLAQYEPHDQHLAVVARQGRPALSKQLRYTLDEDLQDWTTPRMLHAVREAFTPGKHPHLTALLTGALPFAQPMPGLSWVQRWLAQLDLNARQREALLLPFRSHLGLIEGPPGTGKTHVLAWMLIALILEAWQAGRPLHLAVSALTHRAIDNVLLKIQQLLQRSAVRSFPGRCLKWGQRLSSGPDSDDEAPLTYVQDAAEVLETPYLILGATGFGLYQLFESQSGAFPAFFDWVILDEASQMLLPQALLSLVYGKGQYVFCGDVQQLPPVVLGPQPAEEEAVPGRSILAHLLATYGPNVRVRLNETYRLNSELCQLPSRLWYQGDLHPAAANAGSRLALPTVQHPDLVDAILAPQRPVTLVLAEHTTDHQRSSVEADIVATLAARLLLDYGVEAKRLAIVAPHRAQNNAIAQRLAQLLAQRGAGAALPVIDTVERLQGAERDVLLFSVTTSDPDHLASPFLNSPNRFNVAITRARHKLVVVGSTAFFTQVPHGETTLQANYCFKVYYHLCREQGALFVWPQTDALTSLPRPQCRELSPSPPCPP